MNVKLSVCGAIVIGPFRVARVYRRYARIQKPLTHDNYPERGAGHQDPIKTY